MKDKTHILILPDEARMPKESKSFLRWLGFFMAPHKKAFIVFTLLRLARYTVFALLPLVIGLVIGAFEKGWAYDEPGRLLALTGGFMALYGAGLFTMIFFAHESAAQDRMIRGLTLFSLRHLNRLPLSWHEAQGSGGKMQRIMKARDSAKELYNIFKWNVVPFSSSLIAIIISIVTIKAPPLFLLFYLGFVGSFLFVGWKAAKPLGKLHDRHNSLTEKLLSGVYEFVSAVRTVKAFSMERYIQQKAEDHEHAGHGAWRAVVTAIFRKWTLLNMVGLFWLTVILGTCIAGVYGHWLGIGAFATVFFLAYDLWKTLEGMVYIQDQFIEYRNGFMRLTETLTAEPHDYDVTPLQALPAPWKNIAFERVSFTYESKGVHALHDINLSIARGEKVALVGASGAGKSTLARLLMKQMLPENGIIAIDGIDLRHIESAEWLAQTGYVPQDVELFNMSIRDNILLDRVDSVSEDEYRAAVRQAALESFINSLPEKDATMIGERGIKLSGGQRQRLGIARALIRRAELIIFDEATSSLDSLSEQAIQQAIEEAFAEKTLVVIAHRLSTVRHVDRIFVLDSGRLAEQGSFRDLVKKGGAFARLWALQSDTYMQEAV